MRVLTFTRLWPNAVQPDHGCFVEERMRRFAAMPGQSLEVVAPVPWCPKVLPNVPGLARWSDYGRVPRAERRHGIDVAHPRYPVIPKVGLKLQGASLAAATMSLVERMHRARPFDLIDAHFLYPDGFAAAAIARRLGVPLVLSARGSDAMSLPEQPGMRALVMRAVERATMLIAVSRPIRDRLVELGADPARVVWVPNGIDAATFGRVDGAREALGLAAGAKIVLSVGRLERVKGHDLLLDAIATLPGVSVAIVGEGSRRAALSRQAERLGIGDRVHLVGAVRHERLAQWYSACDVFCLPSRNEGHPNALVEALACGAPSVAARVGAVPDLMRDTSGIVVPVDDAVSLSLALGSALGRTWDHDVVRASVTGRGWEAVAAQVHDVFRDATTSALRLGAIA